MSRTENSFDTACEDEKERLIEETVKIMQTIDSLWVLDLILKSVKCLR